MDNFVYNGLPSRVIFGEGTLGAVRDEAVLLGISKALVLSTPQQIAMAERVSDRLGEQTAGIFSNATMHTPVPVTEEALTVLTARDCNGIVSIGGGSTTGLGKALSLRTGLPHLCIPTTYAGSEMTPILGETDNGRKVTIRDMKVLPAAVVYDVELTLGLPVTMSSVSGMNAIAHAVEALYAQDRNPIISLMAADAIEKLANALPAICDNPSDCSARRDALYGAWLCGVCLGSVGMALHHKLCHTLGGMLNLPHAETHTVILPFALAFNAPAAPDADAAVAKALGTEKGFIGLQQLARRLGSPTSLRELGVPFTTLEAVAEEAMARPYWNPRVLTYDTILDLLRAAWNGSDLTARGL
ncbi:maleylacetate reductase [Rhizobium rhizogenes]|uniref:Iron alcohol dehydrogenase protein n=1 Tax=Rhizobium rhizogenes (strain K84 / ATCC BAA-868) TaxID=311403 RepID=B9JM07_RHIR8|nr:MULTISPECIES: maleylacetate reductase [Rhizobium]ACM28721.1 iron alcohol dehydrogenase protein [Rhizobium rhizogenes K84]OCJ19013.1 maleylacetate reductase [Agrobacterium sp. B131/95]EJK88016.1 alcohol dehydrogenase, class IV [Rhizobium sp. AP16]NTI24407.1 maleylacetate reductase [Rhizobium rhizogenes]NTI43713.1 maleylacetate reductase [Rhizobium rhizogenes]